jgi:hypothetical protein
MSQLPEQALSSLSTWLNILAKIYCPRSVTLVGAGNGTGPFVQWLLSQDIAEVNLFEVDANSFVQLVKRTDQALGWLSRQELVVPGMSKAESHNFHQYQLASESSLLGPDELEVLWPNLQLRSEQPIASGVSLASLLPASWLWVDCLPAGQLLQGAALQDTDVLVTRVVLGEARNSPPGSSLAELNNQLAPQGYQLAACFAERNPALAKALWTRDPAWQLGQTKAELQSRLDAETKAKQAAETQVQALQAQNAAVLAKEGELAKAQEQASAQLKALQADHTELKKANEQVLEQVKTLSAEKTELVNGKEKALSKIQEEQKERDEIILRQKLLKDEIKRSEAQLELIKDVFFRDSRP